MPTTKNVTLNREIIEYTKAEFLAALGLIEPVLSVYMIGDRIEVITKSA